MVPRSAGAGTAAYNIRSCVSAAGGAVGPCGSPRVLAEVARHEVLRTTFAEADGAPVQVIAPPRAVELPVVDLAALADAEREAEALRLAREEAQRPFDLARGPLLRATLLRLAEDEHVLLLIMHHIVSDGWSMGVLFRELAALYEAFRAGEPSPLPELPVQYADYARLAARVAAGRGARARSSPTGASSWRAPPGAGAADRPAAPAGADATAARPSACVLPPALARAAARR